MLTEDEMKLVLEKVSETLMGSVNVALNGYDKKLKLRLEELKAPTSASDETKVPDTKLPESATEVLAIKRQLEDLRKELDTKTVQAKEAELRSAILSLTSSTVAPSPVADLLLSKFSKNFVNADGQWLNSEGQTLEDSVKKYLTSDEGKGFVKPVVNNSPNPKGTSNNPTSSSPDKNSKLIDAIFLG